MRTATASNLGLTVGPRPPGCPPAGRRGGRRTTRRPPVRTGFPPKAVARVCRALIASPRMPSAVAASVEASRLAGRGAGPVRRAKRRIARHDHFCPKAGDAGAFRGARSAAPVIAGAKGRDTRGLASPSRAATARRRAPGGHQLRCWHGRGGPAGERAKRHSRDAPGGRGRPLAGPQGRACAEASGARRWGRGALRRGGGLPNRKDGGRGAGTPTRKGATRPAATC